jgi:3-deoxy-D-manno-octulosonate 8-phosphate phosphatase (KDO 8-P phosphatase)
MQLTEIKLIIMDIDGVLTDGSITYLDDKEVKKFNVYDGLGVKKAQQNGIECGVISGRSSGANSVRMKELGISLVYQGISNKLEIYEEIKQKQGLTDEEIVYIGDDVNDLDVLKKVGFACSVQNGIDEVKNVCNYVAERKGGDGAVREIIEYVLSNR